MPAPWRGASVPGVFGGFGVGHRGHLRIGAAHVRRPSRPSSGAVRPDGASRWMMGRVGIPIRVEKVKWDGRMTTVNECSPRRHRAPVARLVRPRRVVPGAAREGLHRTAGARRALDDLDGRVVGVVRHGRRRGHRRDRAPRRRPRRPPPPTASSGGSTSTWTSRCATGRVALEDEEEFHRHAGAMAYPKDVIRGAWSGSPDSPPGTRRASGPIGSERRRKPARSGPSRPAPWPSAARTPRR